MAALAWAPGCRWSARSRSCCSWPIRYLIDGVIAQRSARSRCNRHPRQRHRRREAVGRGRLGGRLPRAPNASPRSSHRPASTSSPGPAALMIHTLRGRMLTHLRSLSLGYHRRDGSTGDTIFRAITRCPSDQEVMIFGIRRGHAGVPGPALSRPHAGARSDPHAGCRGCRADAVLTIRGHRPHSTIVPREPRPLAD